MTEHNSGTSNGSNATHTTAHSLSPDGSAERPDETAMATTLAIALGKPDPQERLNAALKAGTYPEPADVPVLVARCEIEPDFQVREMLTWALVRHPPEATLPLVLSALRSIAAQGRSQALHTLSKIGDPVAWEHITPEHLHDTDDEVARAAWRTAVGFVPADEAAALAQDLARELGRGDIDVQRSLARAFVALGEAGTPVLEAATRSGDASVRAHAAATLRIAEDPESTFYLND